MFLLVTTHHRQINGEIQMDRPASLNSGWMMHEVGGIQAYASGTLFLGFVEEKVMRSRRKVDGIDGKDNSVDKRRATRIYKPQSSEGTLNSAEDKLNHNRTFQVTAKLPGRLHT